MDKENQDNQEVLLCIKRGDGLGATVGYVRSLEKNNQSTNLGIFRSVVKTYHIEDKPLKQSTIRYHFRRFVPPYEYQEVNRSEVYKGLYSKEQ